MRGLSTAMLIGSAASAVFSAWDPVNKTTNVTLSNSNRTASFGGSGNEALLGTQFRGTDVRVIEFTYGGLSNNQYIECGITTITNPSTLVGSSGPGRSGATGLRLCADGTRNWSRWGSTTTYPSYATAAGDNAYFMIVWDGPNFTFYFAVNGVWQTYTYPGTGWNMGTAANTLMQPWALCASPGPASITINTGQASFVTTPPSGPLVWG